MKEIEIAGIKNKEPIKLWDYAKDFGIDNNTLSYYSKPFSTPKLDEKDEAQRRYRTSKEVTRKSGNFLGLDVSREACVSRFLRIRQTYVRYSSAPSS